jgi:small-conductance mechanosensitive channel
MTSNRTGPGPRTIGRVFAGLLLFAAVAGSAIAQSRTPVDPDAAATPDARQVAVEVRAGAQQDSRIASAVAALLLRQSGLTGVSVQVHAGIVTLGGTVPEEPDRARAVTLAKSVKGVTEVVDAVQLDANLHTRLDSALDQVKGKLIRIVAAAPLLVIAMVIVLLAWWLGRAIASRPARWLRSRSHNPYMAGLVARIVQTVVVLLGVLLALNLLGATALVGAVLGSAGVVGLAFGFAFKDIAENYISGVLLSLRRPFAPGDHLLVDSYEGKVVALTSRTTLLMTMDGNHLSLPNALVFKSVVLNFSVNPKRRFEFTMQIDASQSVRGAQQLAMAEMSKVEGVLADPQPSWVAEGFVGGGLSLKFYGWVDQRVSDLGKVRSEALRAVRSAFSKAGIEAPRSVQYVIAAAPPVAGTLDAATEPEGGVDTSVNRDIDPQLAEAQHATDDSNLLDTNATPNDGDSAARTA